MICDINELIIQQKDPINWKVIDNICTNPELKNIITTSLTYAYIFLNTPVPADFINEKLLIDKSINLDTLFKGNKRKSHLNYYLDVLRSVGKPTDQIIYVFRTIFPVKEWMNENYQAQSGIKLIMAYIKYWSFQLNTNIIRRGIRNGN
jgi:hypothetical protein